MRTFFFAPESPRVMALIRIVLGATLVCDAAAHWRYAVELYSTFGPPMPLFIRQLEDAPEKEIAAATAANSAARRVEPLVPVPVPGPDIALLVHTLLVFALLSVTLGWHTRGSLAASIVLSLWLGPLDLPGTFAKHSVIALHLQGLLFFSRAGAVWSLDAWFGRPHDRCGLTSACPRRLMQILVCFIYFGAAITKIKTPAFVNGDLLSFSLLDDHWGGRPFGIWLSTVPHVPLLLSLTVIVYEVAFPCLIWVRLCRLPLLGLALVVHTAMGALLNLGTFSPIVLAALLSFVEERDLRRLPGLGALSHRQVAPSGTGAGATAAQTLVGGPSSKRRLSVGLHLVCGLLFLAAGYGIQHSADWYGAFGRRAPRMLHEISAGDFQEMMAQRPPAYEDYFHHIALGSRVSGNQMFGSSELFHTGQCAYVLARLTRPHPRFEWEGLLIAPDGREAARFTHDVEPGAIYLLDGFELTPALPPGSYRLILQAEGFVVAERRFELQE